MYMPGTLDPQQQQQMGMQQALVDALRQQQQGAPQQQVAGNRVVSAGALGDGMNTGAIGGAPGKAGQNFGTAVQYGTNPFSQQTNMLAAQDAAFR